jgi:hypothetical protein
MYDNSKSTHIVKDVEYKFLLAVKIYLLLVVIDTHLFEINYVILFIYLEMDSLEVMA